jgi:MFS family permease
MITIAGEFHLSYAQRGLILSAFSLTYAVFQIPGGVFVMRCGPYVGPFVACLGGCLSLAALPLCVDAFHAKPNATNATNAATNAHAARHAAESGADGGGGGGGHMSDIDNTAVVSIFYGFMLFLGFLGAGFNPAFHDIIAHKVKLQSRSFVHNTVYSGQQLGSVLATVGVNISIDQFGWRVTFAIAGGICLCVAITWRLVVDRDMPDVDNTRKSHGDPADDVRLSSVVVTRGASADETAPPSASAALFTPYEKWRTVLTSPAFLVICLNHFGAVWVSRVASNWGPTFLHAQEGIPFKDLGYLASIPNLLSFFVIAGSGVLTLHLIKRRQWTVVGVRKFAQGLGLGIPALALIWMNYATSKYLVIGLLLFSGALQGLAFGGYHCNHIDIAPDPNMASLMYSITNSIGQISGVVEPLVDGSILGLHTRKTNSSAAAAANPKHDDVIPGRGAWSTIWFLVAGLSAVCVTAWLTFARGLPLAVVRHTAAVHNNSIEKDTTVDVDVDGT